MSNSGRPSKTHLRLKGAGVEHADMAIRDGYYIEGMQVLHGFLEWQLRLLLMTAGSTEDDLRYAKTWDLTYDFNLISSCKALFIIGKISEEEMDRILGLNRIRNKIIHKIFQDKYEKEDEGIPKREYFRLVEQTKEIIKTLEYRLDVAFGSIVDDQS